MDEPVPPSSPDTPPLPLSKTVEALHEKAFEMRARAAAATDAGWRKFYESGAVAYEQWANQMQSVMEAAQRAENTAESINRLIAAGRPRIRNGPE